MSFHGAGSNDTSALIRSPVPEREVYTERLQKALLCPQLSILTDDRVVPLLSAWVALLPIPVGGSVRRTSYPPESSPPSSSTIKTVSRSRSSSLKSEQQRDRSPEGVATRQLATLFLALQSAGPWLLDLRALSRSTVSGGYSFSWMSSGFGVSVSGLKLAFSYFPLQDTVCFTMDSLWSEAELCKRAKLYSRKVDLDVVLEISNLRHSCQGVLTALRLVLSNDIVQLELARVKEYLNTFRDRVRCKEAWTEDNGEIDVEVENWLTTMMREINGYEDVVPERLSIWLLALPLAFQADGRLGVCLSLALFPSIRPWNIAKLMSCFTEDLFAVYAPRSESDYVTCQEGKAREQFWYWSYLSRLLGLVQAGDVGVSGDHIDGNEYSVQSLLGSGVCRKDSELVLDFLKLSYLLSRVSNSEIWKPPGAVVSLCDMTSVRAQDRSLSGRKSAAR